MIRDENSPFLVIIRRDIRQRKP